MQKSKKIASSIKMQLTLKVCKFITKGILAIICYNTLSNCKVDQKKTIALSQMFNDVRCTYKLVYLYKAYSINTIYYGDKCVQMELFSLENKLYCIQSGVFLTKKDTCYSFLYLLRQIMCKRVEKNNC